MATFSINCEESCTEKLVINYQDTEDISQIMNNLFLTEDTFDYVETDDNQLTHMLKDEHQNLNNDFGSIDEYSSYFVPYEMEDANNYSQCVLDEYKKRLFVANFPYGTELAELVALFKRYGSLDESKCRRCYRKYHFNYAFIQFRKVEDAQRAQWELNECTFNDSGLKLRVRYARYRDPIKMAQITASSNGKLTGNSFYGLGGPCNHGTKKSRKAFRELWKNGQLVEPHQVVAVKNQIFAANKKNSNKYAEINRKKEKAKKKRNSKSSKNK